jgi:BirA family biotin operon repressor/biotin-[acetyl-CoA-carboxylase] ligase
MIGSPHVHHRVTDSTNARARALAAEGAPHGTIVTAGSQTEGRGRQGRTWTAAPGDALLFSALVRGVGRDAALLPLAAALAVSDACEALVPAGARIKWPNDVWLGEPHGRKVAGILLEGRPQEGWAVVGIGLNVRTREFPSELRQSATSLALHGATAGVDDALDALLPALARWVAARPAEVLDAWRSRDALRGRRVRWAGGSGIAAGISESGALVVETADGARVELDAGEVHLQR